MLPQAAVDPMYQYSLAYFTRLFNFCISAAAPSSDLGTRIHSLTSFITEFMYKMVGAHVHQVLVQEGHNPWSPLIGSPKLAGF